MDLEPAERAIKQLEIEANRVAGLGELRDKLLELIVKVNESFLALNSLSGELSEKMETVSNEMKDISNSQNIQINILRDAVEKIDSHVEKIDSHLSSGLKSIRTALESGLDTIDGTVRGISREIDETVKARLERYLAEYQILLRSEISSLQERFDLRTKQLESTLEESARRIIRRFNYLIVGLSMTIGISACLLFYSSSPR